VTTPQFLQTLPDPFFLIAEIGNNHQGNLSLAKKMVTAAADSGAHAVKFQKRDNKNLYSSELASEPYNNPNSFGKTYLEHRQNVELSIEQLSELQQFATSKGLLFFATPFDKLSALQLRELSLPLYKVSSADFHNYPLIDLLLETDKPLLVSTGGTTYEDLDWFYTRYKNCDITLLHCTAAYPAPLETMNLNVIPSMAGRYPNFHIGLSDHENGIDAAQIAYMLGSRVFEKHFTIDRSLKGTDHCFSLEPFGFSKLKRNLQRIPRMLGSDIKLQLDVEDSPLSKMRKSIYARVHIPVDTVIDISMLEFKSPATYSDLRILPIIDGSRARRNIVEGNQISLEDVYN